MVGPGRHLLDAPSAVSFIPRGFCPLLCPSMQLEKRYVHNLLSLPTDSSPIVVSQLMWNEQSFHTIRDLSLKKIEEAIEGSEEECHKRVIIVDDLMYLRSMRRQVYQLARDRGCPMLVVWVQTSSSVAWERNSLRPKDGKTFVAEESFNRIASSFQPPAEEHICDRHSHIVDGMGDISGAVSDLLVLLNRVFDDYEIFSPKNKTECKETADSPQYTAQTAGKVADEILRKVSRKFTWLSMTKLPIIVWVDRYTNN